MWLNPPNPGVTASKKASGITAREWLTLKQGGGPSMVVQRSNWSMPKTSDGVWGRRQENRRSKSMKRTDDTVGGEHHKKKYADEVESTRSRASSSSGVILSRPRPLSPSSRTLAMPPSPSRYILHLDVVKFLNDLFQFRWWPHVKTSGSGRRRKSISEKICLGSLHAQTRYAILSHPSTRQPRLEK